MPEFGSFCLLLALILTVYNLLIGGLRCGARRPAACAKPPSPSVRWNRLGETARRAGIASFVVLCCAAFALVWAAFTNDFSVEYIRLA
jgi:cytochrome c-type biogenesis protein CcmF